MPYTPAQERMLYAKAAGASGKGPSRAVARKMLAEHAPIRTDVNASGHAVHKAAGPAHPHDPGNAALPGHKHSKR